MTDEKKELPSKEELEKINQEIQAKQASTVDSLKKEVTDAVKKDLESERTIKEMQDKLSEQAEILAKSKEAEEKRIKELEDSFKSQIEDIKNMKLGVTDNQNPFKDGKVNNDKSKELGLDLNNPDVIEKIKEESRLAFIKERNLPPSWGQG